MMGGSDQIDDASLATVQAYYKLSSDPVKRQLLCKDDTAIQFLVYVLDSENETILKASLKTILLLSEQSELRPSLSQIYGFQQALQILTKFEGNIDIVVLSRKIYSRIFSQSREHRPLKDIHNISNDLHSTSMKPKPKLNQNQPLKSKILIFQVKGLLNNNHRKVCEEQILKVRGLISITFSMSSSRFVVRCKPEVKAEAIAIAISKTEMVRAQQIVRNESGDEVLVSFGRESETPAVDKENSELPSYLSDDDSPVKPKALAKSGMGKSGNESSWLSNAANFISRSFYW